MSKYSKILTISNKLCIILAQIICYPIIIKIWLFRFLKKKIIYYCFYFTCIYYIQLLILNSITNYKTSIYLIIFATNFYFRIFFNFYYFISISYLMEIRQKAYLILFYYRIMMQWIVFYIIFVFVRLSVFSR